MKTLGKILSLDLTKGNKQCIVTFAENPIFRSKFTSLPTTVLSLNIPVPIRRWQITLLEGTGSYRPSPIARVISPLQTSNYVKCRQCLFKIKSVPWSNKILGILYLMPVEEISNSAYQTQECDQVKHMAVFIAADCKWARLQRYANKKVVRLAFGFNKSWPFFVRFLLFKNSIKAASNQHIFTVQVK